MRRMLALLLLVTVLSTFPCCASEVPKVVTIYELYDEYLDNEVAADGQYRKRLIRIEGVVSTIGRQEGSGDAYVGLVPSEETGPIKGLEVVHCFFKDESGLTSLSKGDFLRVKGRCRGMVGHSIQMDQCSLVDR